MLLFEPYGLSKSSSPSVNPVIASLLSLAYKKNKSKEGNIYGVQTCLFVVTAKGSVGVYTISQSTNQQI